MAQNPIFIEADDFLNEGREKINEFAISPAHRAEVNSETAIEDANRLGSQAVSDANRLGNEAKETAEQADEQSLEAIEIAKDTNDNMNNIIGGETDSAEIIAARKPVDGEAFVTVGERLNKQLGKLSTFRPWEDDITEKSHNEFKERGVNVRWFGAKGDGITDDVEAIQSAIDYVYSLGGGVVLFNIGEYKISQAVRMKDNVTLKGKGSQMWETTSIRTKIVLDSNDINAVAVDFRNTLKDTGQYPDKIIYDLTKINYTFGAGLVNMHVTNNKTYRNAAGVMFNCCPTCFLQNVSIDGTFEVALVSAMSWFTSLKKVYAKGVFIGSFMQGMNASNVDMHLVGGRNTTATAAEMILNVAGKDKIDKSVGLFFRNSPGISFNSLIAEFTYNGLMFYQAGSVIVNAVYLENITNRAVDVKEKSQLNIDGGHIAAVKKFMRITDRASVTTSSIDVTDVETYIEEIDNYSNMLVINDIFPKYYHERLKYIGHFVNNVIVVDSVLGDDGNSGYMYNADVTYPVKTLGKAIEIAERSEFTNFIISLQSDSTYDISTISRSLTKTYRFVKKGTTINPLIIKNSDTSVKLSNADLTFDKGVDIKDTSSNSSSTNLGLLNIVSGNNTLNFNDTEISISASTNGVAQGAYNANGLLSLNTSRCKITSEWLIARPASGLGKLTVIETSVSNIISGNLVSNGIPTGVKMISSDTFNK